MLGVTDLPTRLKSHCPVRAAWRFMVCSIPDSHVSQTRPATSHRNGTCFCCASLRRWLRRSSDSTTRILGLASIAILRLRSAGGIHVRFRELTRFCEFRVCSRRWVEKVSIEVANFLDESEP